VSPARCCSPALRRGSVRVTAGERVVAGQHVGECGNTGNSTEPHVHVQLMDHPRAWLAAGIPFRFTDTELVDGQTGPADGTDPVGVLPRTGQRFRAAPAGSAGNARQTTADPDGS
jgi:murein DD-endopeptidase MepM/ murein hydrolase activator NlpD